MGRVLEPEVMEGDEEALAYDEMDRRRGNIVFQGFAESALAMGVRRGRVLDVGTGTGRVVLRLARLNADLDIEAVDLSHSMLELARTNAAREGIRNVRFSLGDAKQLPFEDGSFDLVVSHQLLHQLPDPILALKEINRVAGPTGALLVRDIRRLPEPLMTAALPFWCSGYSPRLREQTMASFRAGLTHREFRDLVRSAGVRSAYVSAQWLTHQTVARPAVTYQPGPSVSIPRQQFLTGLLKSLYVCRPAK